MEHLEARRLLSAIVSDPSFETPSIATNSSAYNPTGSVWTFASTSGVVNSPSSLKAPAAPDGKQVAFLQTNHSASQYNGSQDGTISQSISLPSAGYYSLNLDAAAEASDVGGSVAAEESFMVTLDGTPVLTGLHPTSSAFSSIGGTFYAGAGSHTFALVSTGPQSTMTFIDQVQLTAVTPGAAAQLVISTVPQSLAAGVSSSAITVQLQDASGLAVTAGTGGVSVSLGTTSGQGLFFNGGGVLTSAVTIAAGSSTTTFIYRDGSAGTPTLTASSAGLTAASQQESVRSVTSSSFLHTSGTNIVDGTGQTIQLRGVNLGSWLTMEGWMSPLDSSGLPDQYGVIQTLDNRFGVAEEQTLMKDFQQNWITVQDLQNIKSAGFNVIRVPVWWADFETLQGQWRSDAFQELDWVVNTAGLMGIYTIIDMHGVVGGQSQSDDTGQANLDNYWTSSYDQQQTNVLMQNIALHYKNNPMVAAYDLLNEPDNAPSDSAVIAAQNRIYSAVRSVDTNHIAIIEGTFDQWNWSMLPSPASQGWTDVVYEMHEYQWNDTGNPAGVEGGTNNQVNDFKNHASYGVPDYVGEFNDFGTGSSTWQYTFQQYDNNNISWSFWSYKATDGLASTQDSWGLYDPTHTLSKPNVQNASTTTIAADWSNVTTVGSFAVNTMLQSALQAAGVSTAATASTLNIDLSGAGPVTLSANGSAITASENGAQFTLSGYTSVIVTELGSNDVLNFNGPLALPFTFVNAGNLTVNVNSGALTFAASAGGTIKLGALMVAGGASAVITPATTNSATTLKVNSLSIGASGTLNVANNEVLINYGSGADPIGSIASWLSSGYALGAWNGPGIVSSVAQTNPSYGLGYADAADAGNPANLISGEIEILYTLFGDANLDGAVNGSDFAILSTNFNKAVNGWDQGDFNYDGAANGADFALLSANFNKGSQIAAAVPATIATTSSMSAAAAQVSTTTPTAITSAQSTDDTTLSAKHLARKKPRNSHH